MFDPFDQLTNGLETELHTPNPAFATRLEDRIRRLEHRHQQATKIQIQTQTQTRVSQRRTIMVTPELIPYLSVSDARAAFDFYVEVFGASEEERVEMDDGRIGHITVKIGECTMYMADEFPEQNFLGPDSRGGGTVALVIDVEDADETYAHALAAGGTAFSPVSNQHGYRSGWFLDPWGHRWSPRSAV